MAKFTLDTLFGADALEDYEQTTELDGREYLLRFLWNARAGFWTLSLYQPDRTPIAIGRVLRVGTPVFWGMIDARLPPGLLVPTDFTGKDVDPGFEDLGDRVGLVYYDADELP